MQINLDEVEVVNNSKARRFEVQIGGSFAHLDYIPAETKIVFLHTKVPEEFAHQGVASKLARTALEYAKDNNLKVIPQCPFVAGYIRYHTEYEPLVWSTHL